MGDLINLTIDQPQQINVIVNQLPLSTIENIIPYIAVKGDKGDKGIDGKIGFDGYTPVKGVDYFDGEQGIQGIQGITGATGSLNRMVEIRVTNAALIVGTNKGTFFIPEELNGAKIIKAEACVNTAGTTTTTINIINVTTGLIVTLPSITINANHKTSYTAVTRSGININNQLIYTANELCANITGVGTGSAGLSIIITFEK